MGWRAMGGVGAGMGVQGGSSTHPSASGRSPPHAHSHTSPRGRPRPHPPAPSPGPIPRPHPPTPSPDPIPRPHLPTPHPRPQPLPKLPLLPGPRLVQFGLGIYNRPHRLMLSQAPCPMNLAGSGAPASRRLALSVRLRPLTPAARWAGGQGPQSPNVYDYARLVVTGNQTPQPPLRNVW
mgnify:CR=1 FL=1